MDTPQKIEPQKEPATFAIAEKDLPTLLGCPPDQPAKVRYLLDEGRDWQKIGRSVRWTLGAVRDYATSLGIDWRLVPGLKEGAERPPEPVVEVFKVTARRTLNPHILIATDGAQIFRVRVRKKDNFRPGMEVRCTHVSADLYELPSNCPRLPGKC